jgi:hypothetical protein
MCQGSRMFLEGGREGTPAGAGVPVHSGIVYGAKTATHQHPHAGLPTGVFAWAGILLGSIRP